MQQPVARRLNSKDIHLTCTVAGRFRFRLLYLQRMRFAHVNPVPKLRFLTVRIVLAALLLHSTGVSGMSKSKLQVDK